MFMSSIDFKLISSKFMAQSLLLAKFEVNIPLAWNHDILTKSLDFRIMNSSVTSKLVSNELVPLSLLAAQVWL